MTKHFTKIVVLPAHDFDWIACQCGVMVRLDLPPFRCPRCKRAF